MKGLREIRKKRGLSQQKVAMDLHITRAARSYSETGKREIPLTRYERAALERIRATRPQIEAERKATDEYLALAKRATA